MTDKLSDEMPKDERLFSDSEAVAASGMPLPSLRVLQAAGAIQAAKAPKVHGGFRRMWKEYDVYTASIAAVLGDQFAWNIRILAEVMSKVRKGAWQQASAATLMPMISEASDSRGVITASEHDWLIELVDRTFLFIIPGTQVSSLPLSPEFEDGSLLLGVINNDRFTMIPWSFGTAKGKSELKSRLTAAEFSAGQKAFDFASAARRNFLSKATINMSLKIKWTWHRLDGRDAKFLQDFARPKERTSE